MSLGINVNRIKIFNSHYHKLLKLIDFISINGVHIIYIKMISSTAYHFPILTGLCCSLIFVTLGSAFKVYDSLFKQNNFKKAFLTLACLLAADLITLSLYSTAVLLFKPEGQVDMHVFIYGLTSATLLMFVVIFSLRIILSRFLIPKTIRIAILGITSSGAAIEKSLRKEYSRNHVDIKFYEDRQHSREGEFANIESSGTSRQLLELAKAGEVDEVYIALPMVAHQRIRDFLNAFSDSTIDVFLVPDLLSYSSHISQLRMFGNIQTISIFSSPFEEEGALIKRAEDIVLGSLLTLVSLPLMIFAAIGIKLTSPGPILFKQSRYGLNGKEIKIWKFRSMNVMENSTVVTQAKRDDPRVTRFGAFLRRTSLDELPQFFNVLQGTMSVVGPRPHAVAHNEHYRQVVENYMIRHKVKPGITGLAQVKGYRGETDTLDKMEKRIRYDLEYIKSWSLYLDLKIVFLTFFRGFVGKNAF